jgi:hypothetical protein
MVKLKTYLLQHSLDFMSFCIKGSDLGGTALLWLVIDQISTSLNFTKVNLTEVTKHESLNQKKSFTVQNMNVEIYSGTGQS